MTLSEIKNALNEGKVVHWKNESYRVVKSNNDYLIKCTDNNHAIGLTWNDGVTMNGKEQDFYTI